MRQIVLRRLSTVPFVLIGVAVVLFVISQVIPSDPVRLIAGDGSSPETRAAIAARLGLDQPFWVQFWDFAVRLVHGDLGVSIRFTRPVNALLGEALPATLELVGAATLIAILIAFPIGILSARFRGSWFDVLARGIVVIGTSTPVFFLSVLGILIFGFYLGWLPVNGRGTPPDLAHLIMPAFILGLHEAGSTTRILRASMIDELNSEHARASRARGLSTRSVLIQDGARNALLPAVTDLGVSLSDLAGSVILVETVFGWPGVGNLLYQAIRWNDFPLVSGAVIALVLYSICVALIVDLLYGVIDPRLRGVR